MSFARRYREELAANGGLCPIESGRLLRLADNECACGRLPGDKTEPCGCWPQETAPSRAEQILAAIGIPQDSREQVESKDNERRHMTVASAEAGARTQNPLRPEWLDDVIGQDNAKDLMRSALVSCFKRNAALPHTLLIGPSGCGKSTFSHVVANEAGVDVFEVEAPVSFDTLMELRLVMREADILKIEEIHQQAIMERRGRSAATRPEVLYSIMEDRTIATQSGVLAYPNITVIGTTTDEGMLPDAFINRFALRPVLDPYTEAELISIARFAALKLELQLDAGAAEALVAAARGVPREIGNLIRNAQILCHETGVCGTAQAREVLRMNRITDDGLTADMQAMLTQLYLKCKRRAGDGSVIYQASVNTIATLIGKARDTKAVALRVEPWLIDQGYLQVGHGGRFLTDAGITRAKELVA